MGGLPTQEAAAYLAHQAANVPPPGWQSIDTAPLGTLIVGADFDREYCAVGRVNAAGEFEQAAHDGDPMGIGFYPTHWLSLVRP